MFRFAQIEQIEDEGEMASVIRAAPAAAIPWERSDYRAGAEFHLFAALGSAALVALLLSSLLWLNVAAPHRMRQKLLMIDLSVTPPPPAHKIVPPQPPHAVQHPQVRIDTPPPEITAPVPVVTPVAPSPIQAPPVTMAPPAPAVAAPAPAPAAPPSDAGDLSSKMISATPPSYPLESRRLHEEGVVVLTVLLSPEGRVSDIAIAQSSGSARLDQAALSAVRKWRWSPIVRNGAPVAVQGRVRIPFVLKR